MRFLISSPNKQFLNTVKGVFRHSRCNNVWAITDMDLNDLDARRRLPAGTIWLRPSEDQQGHVRHVAGEMVISVPMLETFQSFQSALAILDSVQTYRRVDWVAVTPFGLPEPLTATQMRDAYIDFGYKYPPLARLQ